MIVVTSIIRFVDGPVVVSRVIVYVYTVVGSSW